jgi:hypothetical protein
VPTVGGSETGGRSDPRHKTGKVWHPIPAMTDLNDAAERAGYKTTAPTIAVNLPKGFAAASVAESEFVALPPAGRGNRCPISDLSRSTLCEMISEGKIKAIRIRRPGATRGKVLIVAASLRSYLYGLAEQEAAAPSGAGKEVSPHG